MIHIVVDITIFSIYNITHDNYGFYQSDFPRSYSVLFSRDVFNPKFCCLKMRKKKGKGTEKL